MSRYERCNAWKLGECENIKMGRYQGVHHDVFKVQNSHLVQEHHDFDELYAVRKGLLYKKTMKREIGEERSK